ncbi:hypothetical protein JCM19232_4708 [Vibrio ishigakensis]|uniref:DUF3187 family protein n=1 Tax=Vibrio ishigakensis TaxID=1481914 RepID=A0A0B8P9J5_9VIBR|nr:hypothetical protein JCM19232_4708 [Vibrio ishigakensis]
MFGYKSISAQLLLPIVLLTSNVVYAQVQSTPLRTYASSPIQSLTSAMQLRSAFKHQKAEIFATASMASVWGQSDEFQLDYYQNHAFLGFQLQPTERLSAEFMYQYSWAADNGLDSLVADFHDAFGIGHNGRELVGENQFNIRSRSYNYNNTDFKGETMANALHAYFQYQLIENAHHGLALGATLYFNDVNSSPFERSSFEQAIQLNYSYRNKNHTLFSSLGYTFHDESEAIFGSLLNDSTLAFSAGYAYRIFDNHELLVQYHIYEGALMTTVLSLIRHKSLFWVIATPITTGWLLKYPQQKTLAIWITLRIFTSPAALDSTSTETPIRRGSTLRTTNSIT